MAATTTTSARDPSSLANTDEVQTTSLGLAIGVSFEEQSVSGRATHTMRVCVDGVAKAVFDTRELSIRSVAVVGADGSESPAQWSLGAAGGVGGILGQPLEVVLPAGLAAGDEVVVAIDYASAPTASALQWLTPEQTAGKVHPMVYSQAQAIHARSMVPLQDSPAVKFTYTAAVTVPAPLRALMSARRVGNADGVWSFEQPVPIPSYLLALAAGNIVEREIGPRSSVFCEPEMIDACEYEFKEHTEAFVADAEALLTPYEWGRYDLLIQPPSAPYGGMENPCLTFVTPTLLAGDRSLVNVVAHEIGHSWAGNYVTSAKWEDFWLNEGHTVYIERRLLGIQHGEPFRQFEAKLGWDTLAKTVNDVFGPEHEYTHLVPDLSSGIDPDDVFSSVPYEKGFALLFYLEGLVGGKDAMRDFLRAYITKYRNMSITTADWKATFLDHFAPSVDAATLAAIDWDAWFYAPGMPPVTPVFDMTLADQCSAVAAVWTAVNNGEAEPPADASALAGWHSAQIVSMLEDVAKLGAALKPETCAALDAAYGLSDSSNYEILFAWVILAIKAEYAPICDVAVGLVERQARMKFTRPTYRALFASAMGHDLALETFARFRDRYHPICAKMVAKDLKLDA